MTAKALMPLALLTVLGLPTQTLAHSIETNYLLPAPIAPNVEVDNANSAAIKFTTQFSTGEPFAHAKVTIYAPNRADEPWLVTQTDENGEVEFQPDQAQEGEWTIDIGEGSHWDSWTVPVQSRDGSIIYGEISDASSGLTPQPASFLVLGAVCLWGGVWSVLVRARRQG